MYYLPLLNCPPFDMNCLFLCMSLILFTLSSVSILSVTVLLETVCGNWTLSGNISAGILRLATGCLIHVIIIITTMLINICFNYNKNMFSYID